MKKRDAVKADYGETDRFGRPKPPPGSLLKNNGASGKHGKPTVER
jgi:hypothetical protein